MAEDKIAFGVEVNGVEQTIESVSDLKKAIKAAKDEQIRAAQVYGESSKEFIEASKNVSHLKDKVEDLADSTKSLKGSGIERASEGFNQLGDGLRNLDFDKVKVGLTAMKSALAAVGIGLIVQAVMYLVENFDELSKGSGILAKSLRFVGDVIGNIKDALFTFTDALGLTNTALDKMGDSLKANADKAKEALAGQTAEYDRQIAIAKASGKSAIDLEIAKQQAIIDTNKALVEQTIAYVRQGGELDDEKRKLLSGQLEAIKNAVTQQDVIELNHKTDQLAKETKHADDLKKIRDKATEDNIKENEDSFNAYVKRLSDEEIALAQQKANELAILQQSRADIANAEQADKDTKNQQAMDEATLKVAQDQTDLEAQQALLELQRQQKLDDLTLTQTQRDLINQEFSNKEIDLEDQASAKKKAIRDRDTASAFSTAQSLTNSLQGLSDAYFAIKSANGKKGSAEDLANAKKQFDINKGLSIASAVISGIQGVVNALSAQSVVPEPFGTVLKVVTAAGVAGAAVANVAKISSTQFNAGGGAPSGGGAVTSVPIPSPPNIDTKDNNTNQDTKFGENGENKSLTTPVIKVNATVGVDEISTKTNRVNTLENQSTF